MTPLGLVDLLSRRWYVLVGGLLAVLAIVALLTTHKPLYVTRIEVIFLEPGSTVTSAPLFGQGAELAPFVAAVEETVNEGKETMLLNTDAATLWGSGVRDGTVVRMRNFGSQWSPSFPLPELVVESVGDDPEAVRDRSVEALQSIRSAARELQTDQGISEPLLLVAAPKGPIEVNQLVVPRRERARSVLAALTVGAGLTIAAAVGWDRFAARSGRRPEPAEARPMRAPADLIVPGS